MFCNITINVLNKYCKINIADHFFMNCKTTLITGIIVSNIEYSIIILCH